jgi:hypothetical protein
MLTKPIALVAVLALCPACTPEDPGLSKDQFSQAAAQAACTWIFACCDTAEQKNFAGNATDKSSCVVNLSTTYAALYKDADIQAWDPKAAQAQVDTVSAAAKSCPKTYDPMAVLSKNIVLPNANPGDSCTNSWQCTTRFCKGTVCANPIKSGGSCSAGEPCETNLRCVTSTNTCQALKVDNSTCVAGNECISGACGGGQCINSPTYTCDGK